MLHGEWHLGFFSVRTLSRCLEITWPAGCTSFETVGLGVSPISLLVYMAMNDKKLEKKVCTPGANDKRMCSHAQAPLISNIAESVFFKSNSWEA